METQAFIHKMKDYNFAIVDDTYIIFKLRGGKWELYNAESDASEIYNDVVDMADVISTIKTIEFKIDGGRGASGDGKKRVQWEDARGGGGGDVAGGDLPARMNNKIKVKSEAEAIRQFRAEHGKDTKEHLINVDKNGFVSGYNHGGSGSVRVGRYRNGDLVIHNHPGDGTFSPTDMLMMAGTRTRGIVATHSKGYRIVTKGTHFDSVGFTKAIKRKQKTGFVGKDIDKAVDKFLKANQKRYGYKFSNVLD